MAKVKTNRKMQALLGDRTAPNPGAVMESQVALRIQNLGDTPTEEMISVLKELESNRKAMERSKVITFNRAQALIKRYFGYHAGLPEKERSTIKKKAAAVWKGIMKDTPCNTDELEEARQYLYTGVVIMATPLDAYEARIDLYSKLQEASIESLEVCEDMTRYYGVTKNTIARLVGTAGSRGMIRGSGLRSGTWAYP